MSNVIRATQLVEHYVLVDAITCDDLNYAFLLRLLGQ